MLNDLNDISFFIFVFECFPWILIIKKIIYLNIIWNQMIADFMICMVQCVFDCDTWLRFSDHVLSVWL